MIETKHLLELNIGTLMGIDYVGNNKEIAEVLKASTTALLITRNYMEDFSKFMNDNNIDSFEDIVKMYPAMYYNDKKMLDLNRKYKTYSFWIDEYITPDDFGYDFFFAYKLKQTGMLNIDDFLDYHLKAYYDSDIQTFRRFLSLCCRKYKNKYLDQDKIEIINEWIAIAETEIKSYSNVTYTGDKTNFLKLMYSLYHAGLINNGKGQKIKTIQEIAKFFNIDYPDNDTSLYKAKSEANKNGYNKYKFVQEIVSGYKLFDKK